MLGDTPWVTWSCSGLECALEPPGELLRRLKGSSQAPPHSDSVNLGRAVGAALFFELQLIIFRT